MTGLPFIMNDAFADHSIAEVSIPAGTSVPGCEETNECYIPYEVTIDVGGEVTWTNDDSAAHTVTSGTPADGPDNIFDSGLFMAGATFSVKFDGYDPGQHNYHCMVHPWMEGVVTVQAAVVEERQNDIDVSISTSELSYSEDETIVVLGNVSFVLDNTPLTLQLFSDGDMINITQLTVAQDGTFSHTILAQGSLWKEDGEIVVRASYGEGNIAETTFDYFTKNGKSETTNIFEVDAGDSGTFDVEYTIRGGIVKGMIIDPENFALIVIIESEEDGTISLDLPRSALDATKSDGTDDTFIILIDGIEVPYQEPTTDTKSRIITIDFEQGDSDIRIIGNQILTRGYNGETPCLDCRKNTNTIVVSTDKTSYSDGETIVVTGEVKDLLSGIPVSLHLVAANGDLVTVQQLEVDSEKKFSTELTTGGALWKSQGMYTIKVLYGSQARTSETTFDFGGSSGFGIGTTPEHNQVSIPAGTSVPGCEEDRTCYLPFTTHVSIGEEITWHNNDSAAHTVTSGTPAKGPDGIFDSGLFMAGATFSHKFEEEGAHHYFCMVHPWMEGEVIVGRGGPTHTPVKLNVQTDRNSYHLGDDVTVTGYVRPSDSNTSVLIRIFSSDGNLAISDKISSTYSGSFTYQFKIAGDEFRKTGTYTLQAISGSASDKVSFLVKTKSSIPMPNPISDHGEVSVVSGSSVPGCEETNSCYIPYEVRVNSGGRITWYNNDAAAHTVTSGTPADGPNGLFDSSLFMAGATFSVKFDGYDPGQYNYFCMVHPWMEGIVLVGEGTSSPSPKPIPEDHIDLQVTVKNRVYDINTIGVLHISVEGTTSPQNIAIEISDPRGTTIISRSVTVDPKYEEPFEFKIDENFKTGNYKVTVTMFDNGRTIKDTAHFKVKSQYNTFKITSVQAADQQGNSSYLEAGEIGFIKVNLESNKSIATLVTVNIFDSDLTSIGIGSVKTTLSSGKSEIILSFMIPEDTSLGLADIYVNAFSDWPSNGGVPLTGEVSVVEEIQ